MRMRWALDVAVETFCQTHIALGGTVLFTLSILPQLSTPTTSDRMGGGSSILTDTIPTAPSVRENRNTEK